MTAEEAAKVARILAQADGECSFCANQLADEAMKLFPEHDWKSLVQKHFDYDLDTGAPLEDEV